MAMDDKTKVTILTGVVQDGFNSRLVPVFLEVLRDAADKYLNECEADCMPFSLMDFATHVFYNAGRQDAIDNIASGL